MAFQSHIPVAEQQAFLQLARERYVFARQLDADDRADAEADQIFAAALERKHADGRSAGTTQWDLAAALERINSGRPCLTENRLQTFTAQVVNDGRQDKPAIKVTALDNGTKETADYFQGRIRQIEYESRADIAYDTAREQQVTSGRGFIRITTEYEPKSFRQRAKIERIQNQFSVVFGPSREYDCSDADYCFVVSLISKEEHERQHGKDTTAARTNFASEDNPAVGWLGVGPNGEMVQKAEYWLKCRQKRTLCELSNGNSVWQDELPPGLERLGIRVTNTREEDDITVWQHIIDGADILDETQFLGPYIPIVPQWGRETYVQGQRRTCSLIRFAKDPQRLLNLYVSGIAEQIAQMPKTPWLVPVGGIPPGSVDAWNTINTIARDFIYYNSKDPHNQLPLEKPSRVINEPPIQALVIGYNQAVDSIKAAMGIFDASLGARSNETAGIAIEKRQKESDTANFHFHDNEARTRNQVGRILLCLIPTLDAGKVDRTIRAVDGKTRVVRVGEPYHDTEENKIVHHDLTKGNYGLAVNTGPGYTSQRKEAADIYGQIAAADKNFMSVAGDLYFRTLDAPFSDQIADRYQKVLPPVLQDQKGQPQIPAQAQQMLQQYGQMVDQLTATLQQLQTDIDSQRVQWEARERIAALQENTKKEVAIAGLQQQEGLAVLQGDLAAVKHRLELLDAQSAREHAMQLQAAAQEHQAGLQMSDQAHQESQQAAQAAAEPAETSATPEE